MGYAGLLVVSGKPGTFIAGADVDAIRSVESADEGAAKAAEGQRVLGRLASLGMPTVAVIDGACVGGGAELACWCTGRVASTSGGTRIGFPEVKLGIVPGFGGTQRLPHLIGLPSAILLATTGRLLGTKAAKRMGLVDRAVEPAYLLAEAARLATSLAGQGRGPRNRRHVANWPVVRDVVTRIAARRVASETRGRFPAPAQAVRLCRLALDGVLPEGLAEEARTVGQLLETRASRSLLHLFDVTRDAKRGGVSPDAGALVG